MARSRKVEARVAEQNALVAFWECGFDRLGVRELEARTGINRFLLKTNYGGKIGLFLILLEQYTILADDLMFSEVRNGGIEEIALSFEKRVTRSAVPEIASLGCLITNTVAEFANTNPDVTAKVDAYFWMVKSAFREALKRDGDTISPILDIDELSEFLLNAALGLNVRIRAEGISESVKASAYATATLVRAWQ